MKVILQHNVHQLGIVGDIVTVRPGYARNYLIPRGLALPATGKHVKLVEHNRKRLEQRRARVLVEAQDLATRVENVEITLERNAGEEGKLFGSVTSKDLEAELLQSGVNEISRKQIALKEPIKQIGSYEVTVRIHTELKATLKVTVNPTPGSPASKKREEEPPPPPPLDPEAEAEEEALEEHGA